MQVLITGGAGYIGSHTCVELLNAGYEIVVFDNFVNSNSEVISKVKKITGKEFLFYEADILNRMAMEQIFSENNIDAVIHFAGLKAVGESTLQPLRYYENNVVGTIVLLENMIKYRVKRLVFSSSATVYGNPPILPIKESSPLLPTNPYGRTKLTIENTLYDLYVSDTEWSISLLRYFNPIGAHKSGLIGDNPNGIPNNLMPFLVKVASGELEVLNIFGNDYPTRDGTGVRDYIHVVDLSLGHIKAVEKIMHHKGIEAYNLGTGKGYSVLELIRAFEAATGQRIYYNFTSRREGDIAECYADPHKAKKELGWQATRDIFEMCKDSWRFIKKSF